MSATMATALDAKLIAGLHEQVQLGLEEAAETDRLLASRDFGPLTFVSLSSRWLAQRLELLPPEEMLVVGLRFGVGAAGVGRQGVALLLGLEPAEVGRLERSALAHLLPTQET